MQPLPRIITLQGDLGSGKTSLVKQILKAFGSEDAVNSPTFSLVNEYLTTNGKRIYHTDWYRVASIEELYDAGIDEYVFGNEMLIIEWPEIGMDLLQGEPMLRITIEHENGSRNYHLETVNTGEKNSGAM